jgi:hypothetical protein
MSYFAATPGVRPDATDAARDRPLAPGPPGLTSSTPCRWLTGAVAGISDSARLIFRPAGSA